MYKHEKFGVSIVTLVMKGIMPIHNCSRGLIWFDFMNDTLITYSAVKTKYTACHFCWAVWLSWTGNFGNIIVNAFFLVVCGLPLILTENFSPIIQNCILELDVLILWYICDAKKLNLIKCSRGHAL